MISRSPLCTKYATDVIMYKMLRAIDIENRSIESMNCTTQAEG